MPFTAVEPLPSNAQVDLGHPLTEKVATGGWDDGAGGGAGVEVVSGGGGGGATPVMLEFKSRLAVPVVTPLTTPGIAPPRMAAAVCAGDADGYADR